MSRIRPEQPLWLADHMIFVCYRWLSWIIACVIVLWRDTSSNAVLLLMIGALVNILATLVAQAYVRLVERHPAVLLLDIVYGVVLLIGTGGWFGPFSLHALSALVLPALVYGWRGGVVSGLVFVSLDLALNLANKSAPSDFIATDRLVELMLMMTAAPLFGLCFPSIVDLLRHGAEQAAHRRRERRQPPANNARMARSSGGQPFPRSVPRTRELEQRESFETESLPLIRSTAVRAAEQGTEELRRVIFAPFPAPEMDLPATLDALARRYSQHTGAPARLTLLGRTRALHQAQRAVLVRLSQEALLNVQQHAHAEAIELTLRYDNTSVALLIQDDGVGLQDGTYERPGLHALRALSYRLSELGGRLDVFETEGGGVTVRATAPLE